MKNILIKGTIASGKTYHAKQEALNATGLDDFARAVENGRIVYVPLYEGYGYSDFIKGTELCTQDNKLLIKTVDKQFAKLCSRASDDISNEYAIIIDDIDRTDIATVLGEIVYAIENRGTAVNTQSSEKLTVPENLTIIAVSAVPSMNKLDYAFLRRFEHKEYFSDRGVLEKLVAERKCDAKALDEYDFYNSVIDQYIAYDLREQEKYYLLGHGWFIGKTEALVYQSMRYKVIPMLEEYVRNGILSLDYSLFSIYRNSAETKCKSVARNANTITKKTNNNQSSTNTNMNVVQGLLDDIISVCNNCKGKKQIPHGTMTQIFQDSFEISFQNKLVDHDALMVKLYLNTNVVEVWNYKDFNDAPRSILAELNECKYDRRHNSFQYRMNDGGGSSLYPLEDKKRNPKSIYRYKDTDFILLFSKGQGDKKGSTNYFRYCADQYRIKPENEGVKSGGPNVYSLIGRLLFVFYQLYLDGIKQLYDHTDNKENLYNLIRIIEDDDKWLRIISEKRKAFNYTKDYELAERIFSVKTQGNAIVEGMAVFTHSMGETITKIINGELVTATLEGVYKMADNNYKAIMDSMNIKQMILQGPPGTSKTYGARQFLKEQLEVQEGTDETVIENDLKECQITDELYSKLKDGTIIFDKDFYWDIVQFHPSYGYEDFVRGITVQPIETSNNKLKGEIKPITGAQSIEIEAPSMGIKYETVDKILGKTAKFALKAKEFNKPVYLIIDEINRANVSSVFGELIYALEYRNEKIATPYSVDGINEIEIPDNLYLIGTMNTADKSIGNIDYAVRRRFIFFPMLPDVNVIENSENSAKELAVFLFKKTEELFDDYLNEDYNKDDVQVGHTMFLAKDEEETKLKFVYQVLPILREYYKDGVLISSDGNKIINYLSKFGRNDHISEEELWEELLSEYNLSADEHTADVHS